MGIIADPAGSRWDASCVLALREFSLVISETSVFLRSTSAGATAPTGGQALLITCWLWNAAGCPCRSMRSHLNHAFAKVDNVFQDSLLATNHIEYVL